MSCHNCYGSQTGIGSINTGQYPSNTGNAPTINTFGQKSDLRPADYWNGKLMREQIPAAARRPSGIWPKPDTNCLCNIAVRSFQRADTPTLASQARSIVLPEVPCGGPCNPRDAAQRRIREMRGFNTDCNPRRTIPLAQLPEIDACNATLLAGAPIVAQRCPLQGDILYFNGSAWCLTQLQTLITQCYGLCCCCKKCGGKGKCHKKNGKDEEGNEEDESNETEQSMAENDEGEENTQHDDSERSSQRGCISPSSSSTYEMVSTRQRRLGCVDNGGDNSSESPFSANNFSFNDASCSRIESTCSSSSSSSSSTSSSSSCTSSSSSSTCTSNSASPKCRHRRK